MKKECVFLAIFGLVLAMPFLFSDKVGGKISEDENRYLASFPALNLHAGIKNEFEDWLNDNVAGRDLVRSLYNDINVNVLKTKYDGTNYYQDDWVFLVNNSVAHRYLQKQETMDLNQQAAWVSDYKKIQDFLEQKDVYMCSVVFPHKSEIYTEKFEGYVIPASDRGPTDLLKEIAENNPDLHMRVFYDLFKLKTEEGKQLYSKAYDSSHWNNQGAWVGYQGLMKSVQEKFSDVRILTEADVDISVCERSRVYNGKTYVEEDLEYFVKNPLGREDPSWFASIGYSSSDQWNSYRYYKNTDESLPKILIVGDSYVWMFMLPWISESFSETVFIHQLDSNNLEWMQEILKPDIVVFAGLENTMFAAIRQAAESLP